MDKFKKYLLYCKENEDDIYLFADLETLTYNKAIAEDKENNGLNKQPSLYKNMTYACGVSYEFNDVIEHILFFDFGELFECVLDTLKNKSGSVIFKQTIYVVTQNGNKYDNHFLLHDLIYYYNVRRENMYMKNATTHTNSVKLADLKRKENRQAITLEKRVKSKNNLEMTFFLKNVKFITQDVLPKTNLSMDAVGKKLHDMGIIKEEFMKQDYAYDRFDNDNDMTTEQAKLYAYQIYLKLSDKDKIYIRNDCYLLVCVKKYYSDIFPNFDYNALTLTQNISKAFNDNDLTSIQMLNRLQSDKKVHLKYTDYFLGDENYYDFLKPFYKGGMNLYNVNYLGKMVEDCFGLDINHSYPYAMFNFKIPTFLSSYQVFNKETPVKLITDNDNKYYLYRITQEEFNYKVLDKIDSHVLRAMFVKYYTNTMNDYVNINTFTIKTINMFLDEPLTELDVLTYVVYDCVEFGSKEFIFENYKIKTQGSMDNKIIMHTPFDYEVLDIPNDIILSPEEINNAKVYNNGAYGIPALRPFFNLFRLEEDKTDYYNIQNGFKNTERNIVFSIFTTSVAFYNLLSLMEDMTHQQIDEYYIYSDTDSHYFKKQALKYISDEKIDKYSLGKWSYDVKDISHMYVLNHKKYVYYNRDKKLNKKTGLMEEKGLVLKCGGVRLDTFNMDMDIHEFVKTQFSDGVELNATKSILNKQGVVTIYPSTLKLEIGKNYPTYFTRLNNELKNKMIKQIRNELNEIGTDDIMYIESNVASFSMSDVFYEKRPIKDKMELYFLKYQYDNLRERII